MKIGKEEQCGRNSLVAITEYLKQLNKEMLRSAKTGPRVEWNIKGRCEVSLLSARKQREVTMPALYTSVLSTLALLLDTVPPNYQTCFIWMPPIMVAPRRNPCSKSLGARHAAPAAGRQMYHWLGVQQCFRSVTRSESIFVRVSSCAV
jgi:hypothetical protein